MTSTNINLAPVSELSVEGDPMTDRVRAVWSSGDFGRIARGYERGGCEFIARLGLDANDRVIDVACGTGNLALPAARTGATVSGIDIAPNLISQARANAAAERLSIAFDVGNAERMPYANGAFTAAVSMFGAMFAPRPGLAASELLRVVRPGGRIAMANWTPTGFIGQMLKATTRYVPPAAGVPSPLEWGLEENIHDRLGAGSGALLTTRRLMTFEYPFSPAEVVNLFRLWYGPTLRAFASLDALGRDALRKDLERLWEDHNLAQDGTTRVHSEYLEVIAIVR